MCPVFLKRDPGSRNKFCIYKINEVQIQSPKFKNNLRASLGFSGRKLPETRKLI